MALKQIKFISWTIGFKVKDSICSQLFYKQNSETDYAKSNDIEKVILIDI